MSISLWQRVENHRELMQQAEDFLWAHPQTGYREWIADKYLAGEYEKLGYKLTRAGNIPGFYTDIDTGRPGPKLMILGELDSLLCAEHPQCDPATGAVHACGHCAQSAALLGLAAALAEPRALAGLSGSIRLCVVPAEELIEVSYREQLREEGKVRYFGGKVEFLYRGYFDEVDLCFMVHTSGGEPGTFSLYPGGNGCLVKNIGFHGKAAHAGGAPHLGINALYAANLGMSAVNALRETFVDDEHIRFHPIVTCGGAAVNAIPATVNVESFVRGATMQAIVRENRKVNRALAAGAAAMGAGVLLQDRPGYAPLHNDETLNEVAAQALAAAFGSEHLTIRTEWDTGCTDMGDLSCVMPCIQANCSGASGTGHGKDYYISDFDSACMHSAKGQAAIAAALLENGAKEALRVKRQAKPLYNSFTEYFAAVDAIFADKEAVEYCGDDSAVLHY